MKLLVTTDFSLNSKGAIRFAQTLAKQTDHIDATFYHAIHIMKPPVWSEIFFKAYQTEEIKRLTADLKEFIHSNIGTENGAFTSVKFVVDNCISTEKDIITFAEKNDIDFICIATQGAGMLRKIMGTHTSYIVNNCKVPVMVIPSDYSAKSLKKATYLSDFENLKEEVFKILKFSKEISLQLEVLHYSSIVLDNMKFESHTELFNTKEFENIKLSVQKNNFELSLLERIKEYVQKSNPELLILFTNGQKGFFESLFMPSYSSELTYTSKVPVLIFSK